MILNLKWLAIYVLCVTKTRYFKVAKDANQSQLQRYYQCLWTRISFEGLLEASIQKIDHKRPDDVCLEIQDILHYFGAAKDPLLESSRLLEQSQAHFIAALRCAATQPWRICGFISFHILQLQKS